jgi:polyisoprenoid-binding protein YceI
MKKLTSILSIVALLMFSAFNSADDFFAVDLNASELKWTGYHLAKSYEHQGNVKLKSGKISIAGNKITGGEFVIDMNTISNNDLTNAKENAKLVNHLKSTDFFNVKAFPEARLVIKKSEPTASGLAVTGDLTIRGITRQIEFVATLKEPEAEKIEVTATIVVQRTDFKVMYGWKVENAMLSGEFKMDVKLLAKK